jgi:ribosomal protein S18 acetylase RimI-like enzyme
MGTRPRERRPAVVSAAPRNRVEQRTREEHLCVAIRRVRPGEKAEFEKMAIRHFKELDGSFVPTQRWLDGFFRVSALGEPSHAWWATVDGKKVGFVVLTVSSHLYLPIRTGRVEELYVIPEFRRQGVGRMLFRYAATVLKRAGSVRIDLTVLDDNSPARQFWTAQGFRRRAEDYRLEIREAK